MTSRGAASRTRADVSPGLFLVCKPPGMTSHDVVSFMRRITGERHTGHAGTLDPAAVGVLLILVGQPATRLSEYLLDLGKVYMAEIRFGQTTTTQDWTGTVTGTAAREELDKLDSASVAALLPGFTGALEQVPPMVSAVQVGGERLYRLAREGLAVRRRPRPINVYRLELLDFFRTGDGARTGAGPALPTARVRVACSRGTFVRTLAHDLGQAAGVGAHLGFLVREAVGDFRLERTWTLDELQAAADRGELGEAALGLAEAVGHLPAVRLDPEDIDRVRRGEMPLIGDRGDRERGGNLSRVLDGRGRLVALAMIRGGRIRPKKVLDPWEGEGKGRRD